MTPEQRLWQTVVMRAIIEGLSDKETCAALERKERRKSDAWIRAGRQDFQTACAMAGFDPQFIRDAYVGGRIDLRALNNFDKYKNERAAA